MTVTEYIVKFLKSKGVPCVFELSGGMIMQLIDTIHLDGTIKLVTVHHEQTSSFAADAVGRMTGIPGVAIATSGPGATNLLTGIGSCFFDSSPALFITGQVNTSEQKKEKNVRQLGFQETDIVSMVKPITKFAYQVTTANQVPEYLEKAYNIAISGRCGPSLIDIPMDVFRASIDNNVIAKHETISTSSNSNINEASVDKLITDLKNAQRPIILAGGGIRSSGSCAQFKQVIKKLNIPVVTSLLGVDILPYNDDRKVGMIGTYGNRWANISLYNSDFILVLGSRLDIRQTGADTVSFKNNKTIYHVDCEPEEINNRVLGCEAITGDLKAFLTVFFEKLKNDFFEEKKDWLEAIAALKKEWPDTNELKNIKGINPNVFMHALSNQKIDFAAYVVDVGQHQMWAAQSIDIKEEQRFLTSGGMGAMGFALPAGIGATICTNKPVCVIAGDAGFQLNIQELQTIVRNNLPVKIIVINNNCHGMTRQFQETYFKERYQSTIWGYSAPDFEKVAQSYGIKAETVSDPSEIDAALVNMASCLEPYLLQVMIDTHTNVYPKLAFGLPMSEMEPFAKPMEMEST